MKIGNQKIIEDAWTMTVIPTVDGFLRPSEQRRAYMKVPVPYSPACEPVEIDKPVSRDAITYVEFFREMGSMNGKPAERVIGKYRGEEITVYVAVL